MNAAKPSSPCVQICQMDAKTALCVGCGRTMEEISNWWRLAEPERLKLMETLPARIAAAQTNS
jgi:predicted Fe-S protein YdhL (DUF1289 family)